MGLGSVDAWGVELPLTEVESVTGDTTDRTVPGLTAESNGGNTIYGDIPPVFLAPKRFPGLFFGPLARPCA